MKYTITYNWDGSSIVDPEPFNPNPGDEVTYIYPPNPDSCIGSLTTIWNKYDRSPDYSKQLLDARIEFLDFGTIDQ